MSKVQVLEIIRKRFEIQGGTGFLGLIKYRGMYCALGAVACTSSEEQAHRKLREMGCPDDGPISLTQAHDDALDFAVKNDMEGIQYHFAFRALIDTPAYDYVMQSLERWATEGDQPVEAG